MVSLLRRVLLAVTVACASAGAAAQSPAPMATFMQTMNASPDLQLPTEGESPGLFTRAPALLKPEGNGPFPALLVHHTCGGVRGETMDWAKRAVREGYVALVIDSLGPRGLKTNCIPPTNVPVSRGVKDAFDALAHLRNIAFVDKDRIGVIGFSWGAMVAEMVSSPEVAASVSPAAPRFQAAVSLYPMCYFGGMPPRLNFTFEYLRPDTDRPLLVLMGEQDTETPPSECLPRLEKLKAANAPVEWHLYPDTTHCWDCSSLNGFRKTDFQGHQVVYRYDRGVTEDSAKRAFEFFAKHLAKK